MYQIFHQKFILFVSYNKNYSRSLKKHQGRDKNVGSVRIPEHNYFFL